MAKITNATLTINGISGKKYSFNIYSLDTKFAPIGGIYIFTKRYQGIDSIFNHDYIYCGKTRDFSTRFDNHHKENCIKKNNANCICIKSVATEEERVEIESDILKSCNFKCNEILN